MAKMSTLLLGAPERLVRENESTTWETNKIGGTPDWFIEGTQQPCCSNCGKEMTLVTQIYCPLNESPYHRCLYIFVCTKKGCSDQNHGWKVVRTQLLDEKSSQKRSSKNCTDDWGEGQDDWGEGQDDWGEDQDEMSGGQDQADEEQSSDQPSQPLDPTSNTTSKLSEMAITDSAAFPTNHQTHSVSDTSTHQLPSKNEKSKSFAEVVSGNSERNTPHDKLELSNTLAAGDSGAFDADVDGVETAEDQELGMDTETIIDVGEEGAQRMLGLLAVPQEAKNGQLESVTAGEAGGVQAKTVFPAHYLEVFAESDLEMGASESAHIKALMQDYMRVEGKEFTALLDEHRKGQKGSNTEQYDKTSVKHGDKLCYKFIKRLQLFPQQCVRYQWNGNPLLLSQPSRILTTDRCQSCGSSRVFELQLVSPLIPLLVLPGETESRVEFGAVLVFTCEKSCWSDGTTWREEAVAVQHDPYHHILK